MYDRHTRQRKWTQRESFTWAVGEYALCIRCFVVKANFQVEEGGREQGVKAEKRTFTKVHAVCQQLLLGEHMIVGWLTCNTAAPLAPVEFCCHAAT